MRIVHYIIGTALGSGYFPVAPGTAGSLLALFLFWFLPVSSVIWIILILLFFILGVCSGSVIEKEQGHDPQIVVIDEVVGQWMSLLFIPHTLPWFMGAFLLFRLFDIWKPWPVDKLQNLPGGWGIMMDDVMAGIYTALLIHLLLISGIFQ